MVGDAFDSQGALGDGGEIRKQGSEGMKRKGWAFWVGTRLKPDIDSTSSRITPLLYCSR